MTHPFESKGIFWWQVPAVLKGDPEACAGLLATAGFESVYIKAAYKKWTFRPVGYPLWGENIKPELVQALHARGLAVVGWSYIYGGKWWSQEARIAASQVNRFDLDGWVWDVEAAYDKLDTRVRDAHNTMAVFKNECARDIPTAFCSWARFRSPSGGTWHPEDMARAFMEHCDYGMPMTYWGGTAAVNALSLLGSSLDQWRKFTDKPIIPVGRAYVGDGGDAMPEAMLAFEAGVREHGCPGISWWVLDQAASMKYHNGGIWAVLAGMDGFGGEQPPPEPDPEPEPPQEEPEATNVCITLYIPTAGAPTITSWERTK